MCGGSAWFFEEKANVSQKPINHPSKPDGVVKRPVNYSAIPQSSLRRVVGFSKCQAKTFRKSYVALSTLSQLSVCFAPTTRSRVKLTEGFQFNWTNCSFQPLPFLTTWRMLSLFAVKPCLSVKLLSGVETYIRPEQNRSIPQINFTCK